MRRGHQIQRATNSWNTASAVHLPSSIYLPATCALVYTECHASPSVAEHASISNSETSRIGGVQDHSGHPGTSQPLTPQPPSCKATSQDPADTEQIHTNTQLVGFLTISQNQTIFEISIRRTSIENVGSDPVLHLLISIPRHDKLAISTPIQTPCWAFSKFLCANSPVKKPSK